MLFNIWFIFITIPKTVIGISAPYLLFAPYFPSRLFSAVITHTMLIWVIKLLIPSIDTFLHTPAFNLKLSLDNFIDLNLLMYATFKTNVSTWLITVAMAAPATPLWNTNINIGSNIVFSIAPVTILNIAYLGLPSALIIEFKVVPSIEKGNPIAIIFPYVIAKSFKLSVHPNNFKNCGKNINVIIQKKIDTIVDNSIPLPIPVSASFFFFSPSFRLKYADAPSPNIKENANPIITNGNTTFVAPFPKYPTPCPMNIWSTMLYNEFTNIETMQGIENFNISLPIFSFSSIFSCSIFYFIPPLFCLKRHKSGWKRTLNSSHNPYSLFYQLVYYIT